MERTPFFGEKSLQDVDSHIDLDLLVANSSLGMTGNESEASLRSAQCSAFSGEEKD